MTIRTFAARLLLAATLALCSASIASAQVPPGTRFGAPVIPPGVTVLRGVAYGTHPAERFDVYLPANPRGAPVLFMVHGGGWRHGDKAHANVVENKVAHWVPRGFILVSTNYPMLPEAMAIEQARAVARAVATAQRQAAGWGGDPNRFILMGHSAGAHLVALVNASPDLGPAAGALPWLGTVSLDSGAINVPELMQRRHLPLYDAAFGTDPAYWVAASPYDQLVGHRPPILLVCAEDRASSCPYNQQYALKATRLRERAQVLQQRLTHGEINAMLGLPGAYTDAVDAFLRTLDPAVAARL